VIYTESIKQSKENIMDTRKAEELLSMLVGSGALKSLTEVQYLSTDGSFHTLIAKDTLVVSYESKVYMFPITESDVDEVINAVSYMFLSVDPTKPEAISDLRKKLKVLDDDKLFLALQLEQEGFISTKFVTVENVIALQKAELEHHANKTLH
jgi:hypothetical protein